MTKNRHHHGNIGNVNRTDKEGSFGKAGVDLTPGRASAEGPPIESPSHERWEQHTADRDPAEGPDFTE